VKKMSGHAWPSCSTHRGSVCLSSPWKQKHTCVDVCSACAAQWRHQQPCRRASVLARVLCVCALARHRKPHHLGSRTHLDAQPQLLRRLDHGLVRRPVVLPRRGLHMAPPHVDDHAPCAQALQGLQRSGHGLCAAQGASGAGGRGACMQGVCVWGGCRREAGVRVASVNARPRATTLRATPQTVITTTESAQIAAAHAQAQRHAACRLAAAAAAAGCPVQRRCATPTQQRTSGCRWQAATTSSQRLTNRGTTGSCSTCGGEGHRVNTRVKHNPVAATRPAGRPPGQAAPRRSAAPG
jgi:hypothetical protein